MPADEYERDRVEGERHAHEEPLGRPAVADFAGDHENENGKKQGKRHEERPDEPVEHGFEAVGCGWNVP